VTDEQRARGIEILSQVLAACTVEERAELAALEGDDGLTGAALHQREVACVAVLQRLIGKYAHRGKLVDDNDNR
jgi:hypothetical protein